MLESLKGRSAAIEEGRKFFKGLDVIGVDDPARMKQLFDGWTKALGVEGSDLDMGGFLQMIRQSRTAGATLNDRFLTLIAPQLAQDPGDARLGTSLASASSQLIARPIDKGVAGSSAKYGLRDANGEYIDKRGLQNDPFEHLMKTVLPALQKHGVDINDNNALADLFTNLFSNRTVSDVFTKMATQRDQIMSKIANYEKAPGLAGADRLLAKDPTTAFSALTAQTTNLINALTNPLVPAATDAMNGLVTGIGKLASALAGNKDVAAIAGLGSAAAVAGGSAWLSWRGLKAAGEWLGGGAAGAASKAPARPFEAVTKGGPSILASIGKTLGLGVAALGVNAATKSVTGRDPLAEATALIDRVKGGSLTGEDRGNIVASQNALRKALGLEGFFARIEGKAEPKTFDGVYGRDFTLGSKGGFSRTGTVTPPSRVGHMSNRDAKHVAPGPLGQSVDIAKQFDEQVSRIEDAGRQSGLKFSSALALELSKAETATAALALRLKSALSFTASPVVSLRIGGGTAAAGQSIAGERAAGGPVMGGKTYLVGEKGPELFRAPTSGEIVPNHRLQRLTAPETIAKATGHQGRNVTIGDTNVSVSITTQGDPEAIAKAAARAVSDQIRRMQDEQHALLSD